VTTAGSTKGSCTPPTPPPTGAGGTAGAGGVTSAGGAAGAGGTPGSGGTPTVCSAYGQLCTSDGDCCNGVPCTSGRCVYPIH
jgi:hypothetical protein